MALDNIYVAMKGKRIFERFGFNLPKNSHNEKRKESQLLQDYLKWEYHPESNDWLSKDHESPLSNYSPHFN